MFSVQVSPISTALDCVRDLAQPLQFVMHSQAASRCMILHRSDRRTRSCPEESDCPVSSGSSNIGPPHRGGSRRRRGLYHQRVTSNIAFSTAGLRQFRSGCSDRRSGSNTGSWWDRTSTPGRRKSISSCSAACRAFSVAPDVPVAMVGGLRRFRIHEPRCWSRGVIHDEVENDADACASCASFTSLSKSGSVPYIGSMFFVVGDVVAEVDLR